MKVEIEIETDSVSLNDSFVDLLPCSTGCVINSMNRLKGKETKQQTKKNECHGIDCSHDTKSYKMYLCFLFS